MVMIRLRVAVKCLKKLDDKIIIVHNNRKNSDTIWYGYLWEFRFYRVVLVFLHDK